MWDRLDSAIKETEEFMEKCSIGQDRLLRNQIAIMEALKTIMEAQSTLLKRTRNIGEVYERL